MSRVLRPYHIFLFPLVSLIVLIESLSLRPGTASHQWVLYLFCRGGGKVYIRRVSDLKSDADCFPWEAVNVRAFRHRDYLTNHPNKRELFQHSKNKISGSAVCASSDSRDSP